MIISPWMGKSFLFKNFIIFENTKNKFYCKEENLLVNLNIYSKKFLY